MDLIKLLAPLDLDECMRNVSEFPDLVALAVNQSTDELVMIHHISKVGKALKKSKKAEKVTAYYGFGSLVSILPFKAVADLFSKDSIAKIYLPSGDEFETFESVINFKNLKLDADKKSIQNIILLSPFIVKVILSASCQDTLSLAHAVSVAAANFKDWYKDHLEFAENEHKEAALYLLGFLHAHQKGMLKPLPCRFKFN